MKEMKGIKKPLEQILRFRKNVTTLRSRGYDSVRDDAITYRPEVTINADTPTVWRDKELQVACTEIINTGKGKHPVVECFDMSEIKNPKLREALYQRAKKNLEREKLELEKKFAILDLAIKQVVEELDSSPERCFC